jgi:hypothetical protein
MAKVKLAPDLAPEAPSLRDAAYQELRAEVEELGPKARWSGPGDKTAQERIARIQAEIDRRQAALQSAVTAGYAVLIQQRPNAGATRRASYVATCMELGMAAEDATPEGARLLLLDAMDAELAAREARGQPVPLARTFFPGWAKWSEQTRKLVGE